MERLRSLTLAAVVAALAPGCIHVHTDADGKVKGVGVKAPAEKAAAPAPGTDPEVKPAAAAVPVPAVTGASVSGVTRALGLGGPPATEMAALWQNKLSQLPDPTKGGAPITGIVGQLFLYGPGMKFAPADGKLVVELFDESRPGGQPTRLGGWTLEKDLLKRSVISDERFGKCYALFLPWPSYTPAVSRIRLTAKYEPDAGFALYAPPATVTIDTTGTGDGGSPVVRSNTTVPADRWGGPVVMPANPTGPSAFPAPIPIPPPTPGPAVPGPAAALPAGLPPLAITVPGR